MNERLPKFKGKKLLTKIGVLTRGLTYISETDADIKPVDAGRADAVDVSPFVGRTETFEKLSSKDFFQRLTSERDWFGLKEKQKARRFAELEKLLEQNLDDLTVFKIGRVQIEIYVVGLDTDGNLIGIKMNAVET
jgi:hypothetical protein